MYNEKWLLDCRVWTLLKSFIMEFYECSINNAGTAKAWMKHIQFHTNLIAFYITTTDVFMWVLKTNGTHNTCTNGCKLNNFFSYL